MKYMAVLLLVAACGHEATVQAPAEEMPPMVFEEELPPQCDSYPGGSLRGDDLLTLVNKDGDNQLRCDWEPEDLVEIPAELMMPGREARLRRPAVDAFAQLHQAALQDGVKLGIRSAYRSFETQVRVVEHKLKRLGPAHTARYSAMPGRSQHQLGTAIDISAESVRWKLNEDLGSTAEGRWLGANAAKYGFVLAYPEDEETVTGYAYEPWHYRYIGKSAARELASTGLILEEYLRGCDEREAVLSCPRDGLRVASHE
jgi:D-alanyl-D-alanine carboxypeptidase